MSKLTVEAFVARIPEIGTSPRHAFVLFELGGTLDTAAVADNARAPLCMALAIDASSSMAGERFALAVQAARDVIDALGPDDRFAVIVFDRLARTVCTPSAADDEAKSEARRALDRLRTGVGTNLSGAWRECDDALSRWMIPNAARRIVLLTDGLPSHGEVEPEALRRMVSEGLRRGVETNVVGVGDGVDERLCALVASAGGGRFHYLRDGAQVRSVIAYEVEGSRALVAKDVSLSVAFGANVLRAEVLHKLPCRPDGRNMDISIGPVTSESLRGVLVQIEVEDPTVSQTVAEALARGNFVHPSPQRATAAGFALGARALLEASASDARAALSPGVVVNLAQGLGDYPSRAKVAQSVLLLRTSSEIRSAWDACERQDPVAVKRRLSRARTLRQQMISAKLLDDETAQALPDLDVLEKMMLGPSGEAQSSLRRAWTAHDHNTSISRVVAAPVTGAMFAVPLIADVNPDDRGKPTQ
ncbi:MAG: VWA domain-containing protein [Deltaproteobacteria bacterium]|nr:VWA domain-containing protein [Deltaproteobacteria bacterium]